MIANLVLILVLALTAPTSTPASYRNASDPEYVKHFQYACAYAEYLYGVTCDGLSPPKVVISKIVSWRYYGFYITGDSYVFINAYLDKKMVYSVVLHETMHYVLDHTNAPVDDCQSEEYARRVEALYFNTKYNENWRIRYGCQKRATT